jgi:hypothetical protein
MTHSDTGRYAAKHGPDGSPDVRIAAAVRGKVQEGKFDCAEAERIGSELGVALAEVGRTLDLLEARIGHCQLGLFGYAPEGKAVRPADRVASDLEGMIRAGLADARLPCKSAWGIAAELKIPRMAVSSACETLKIRIKPCQLGAF